jgi:hypothetical protein
MTWLLCSRCFVDEGLRLDAERLGLTDDSACPNCGSTSGSKLDRERLQWLTSRFFVHGTLQRPRYGGHPALQFNEHRYPEKEVQFPDWLKADAELVAETLKVGIFHYGPRFWMLGEVEPLKALLRRRTRAATIERILSEYPVATLTTLDVFYRLRLNAADPSDHREYDSPPESLGRAGRLNDAGQAVMYASQDLEVCVHECRTSVEDAAHVATLVPTRDVRLLDLTRLIKEECSEFESLDLAVQMLFLAGRHSYRTCRHIAVAARDAGFDGLIYPSYFTLARTGGIPFPTAYGISLRRFPSQSKAVQALTVPNLALFGRPLEAGVVAVRCINRLLIDRVRYDLLFGPVGYEWNGEAAL